MHTYKTHAHGCRICNKVKIIGIVITMISFFGRLLKDGEEENKRSLIPQKREAQV